MPEPRDGAAALGCGGVAAGGAGSPAFYLFELDKVPPATWSVHSDVRDWISCCTATAGAAGFPASSLGTLLPCPGWVQLERCIFYPLYFFTANLLPFALPVLPFLRLFGSRRFPTMRQLLGLALLQVVLMRVQFRYWARALRWFKGSGGRRQQGGGGEVLVGSRKCMHFTLDQLFELERQNHHYFSTRWILPRSIVEQQDRLGPALVCLAPHGVLPLGISAALNRLLGGRMTRFGAAPVLFKVWGMQKFLRQMGTYPAGKHGILECLARGDHAGLVIDGIPGMFHGTGPGGDEELWLLQRKAVCAIALQAGCPIIPAYCFGTNELWRVVDPLGGLLRRLSTRLDIALTPFLGRWWLPFGPPARRPLLLCFGDPVPCTPMPGGFEDKRALQQAVDAKHAELLDAYRNIFDTHKVAYGRPGAKLTFV